MPTASPAPTSEGRAQRYGLRFVALGYLAALLVVPVTIIFFRTFEEGLGPPIEAITSPDGQHAFWLTLVCVGIAVPLNTVFGVVAALVLVRQRFRGKAILNTIIDLPFAISPVVIGLALLLVYGRQGWIGQDLLDAGHGARDDLRLAAVRRARDDAGAAGDRRRAGAGGQHARRLGLADLLADHAAFDPLGRGLRRRARDGASATTIFVTHDQEEAMDVAEQIVVMNDGRIEQVGTPRDLYESPANEFVMGFVGEVNKVGDNLVRPHDIQILLEPDGSSQEGQIERVAHLGFEVRVELVLDDGRRLAVQTTRQDAEERELEAGQIVYLRPDRERKFASAPR